MSGPRRGESKREIETERLRLRLWRDDDLNSLARWYADPVVMRFMGRPVMTLAESEEALGRYRRHWGAHGFGLWAAEEKETGMLVGRIGLAFHSEWPDEPEVGWLIDPDHWGSGLATEGGRASIRYGFEQLGVDRIVSICDPGNLASRRVMEKLDLRWIADRTHQTLGIPLRIHALGRAGRHGRWQR